MQEGAWPGLAEGSRQTTPPLLGPGPSPGAAEILAALGRGSEAAQQGRHLVFDEGHGNRVAELTPKF